MLPSVSEDEQDREDIPEDREDTPEVVEEQRPLASPKSARPSSRLCESVRLSRDRFRSSLIMELRKLDFLMDCRRMLFLTRLRLSTRSGDAVAGERASLGIFFLNWNTWLESSLHRSMISRGFSLPSRRREVRVAVQNSYRE